MKSYSHSTALLARPAAPPELCALLAHALGHLWSHLEATVRARPSVRTLSLPNEREVSPENLTATIDSCCLDEFL